MKTITIEIKNDLVIGFLSNLESMDMIRVIAKSPSEAKQKPSERFAGCLTKERAEELQTELIKMRNEWERGTY